MMYTHSIPKLSKWKRWEILTFADYTIFTSIQHGETLVFLFIVSCVSSSILIIFSVENEI